MIDIFYAAAGLGVLGLVFGIALSVIGNRFAVPENPLKDSLLEALPGANCGACGYPGCDAYARAVVDEGAPPALCTVGGNDVATRIAGILGIEAEVQEDVVACVMCRGGTERCHTRYVYDGPMDCRNASLVAQGDKSCSFSCLGLGNCERSCPFGAIHISANRLAEVDESKCLGCGICTKECPRGILMLQPKKNPVRRTCSAMERGKVVMSHCTAGCVGCGKCERTCKFGAIKMVNDLPEIDDAKCVGCMRCADYCPTGALSANEPVRQKAVINPKECTHCGACAKICKFDAIMRNNEDRYSVAVWSCTGCQECLKYCKPGAIRMIQGMKLN